MRPGVWEIILIVVLIVILFGSAKIPGMMRNLANGVKTFKKEIKDDDKPKKVIKPVAVTSKTPTKRRAVATKKKTVKK